MIRQLTRRQALVAGGAACASLLAGCSGADETAPSDPSPRPQSTAAFDHRRKLSADDGDEFGTSVAVSADGSTALVGALSDEDQNGEAAGSAYVFTDGAGER